MRSSKFGPDLGKWFNAPHRARLLQGAAKPIAYVIASPAIRRGRIRTVLGSALLSGVIGSSAYALQADPLSEAEILYSKLCEEYSGWKVTRRVEGVSGYYFSEQTFWPVKKTPYVTNGCPTLDGTNFCLTALLSHGFKYVEARVAEVDEFSIGNLVTSPGLFRFELKEEGHPDCGPYRAYLKKRWPDPQNRDRFFYGGEHKNLRGSCVATTKIEEISSSVEMRVSTSIMKYSNKDHIFNNLIQIIETKTNKIIAEHNEFNLRKNLPGDEVNFDFCPDSNDNPMNYIREILAP